MGHGPATDWGADNAASYKSRIGIILFFVYTIIYGTFVVVAVLDPAAMESLVGGQTLAVVYGMGLLFLGLVMAIIYNKLCTDAENRLNK